MGYASDFFEKWFPVAQEESKRSGIPASIILAQGLIESTSGAGGSLSKLSKDANNFFGIKADSRWSGDIYTIASNEYTEDGRLLPQVSSFRKYVDPILSWIDHTDFLLTNPRYEKAGVFSSNDPYEVALALQNAGYAGHSKVYADQLMSIIKSNDLTKYDLGVAPIKQASNAQDSKRLEDLPWYQRFALGLAKGIADPGGTIKEGSGNIKDGVIDTVDDIKDGASGVFKGVASNIVFGIAIFIIIITILIVVLKMIGITPTKVATTAVKMRTGGKV